MKVQVLVLVSLLFAGCGKGVAIGARVSGTMSFLNGTTSTSAFQASARAARPAAVSSFSIEDTFVLTPKKMTVKVTGVGYLGENDDPNNATSTVIESSGCSATYDQTQPSLIKLSDCSFPALSGRFKAVAIGYSTTYEVVIEDDGIGVYSDPSSPTGLTTSKPAGGALPIQVKDTNGGSETNYMSSFFSGPVTIDAANPPQVYVVFNPIHWMRTQKSGTTLSTPQMSGNPPITPAISNFGKASFYSKLATIQGYGGTACVSSNDACTSFLVLYNEATTAASVSQVEGNLQICASDSSSPNVAFNQDGLDWGLFGRLGRDSGGTLAWALPGSSNSANTGVTGYRGFMVMPEAAAVGDSVTLKYKCTTSPPAPTGGSLNYSTGAPSITPDGTIALKLLAH